MKTLIERLRNIDERARWWPELCIEAADEIERLDTADDSFLDKEIRRLCADKAELQARIEELEGALRDVDKYRGRLIHNDALCKTIDERQARIEELARELECEQIKYEADILTYQQRIEELEDKAASFEGSFNAALKDVQRLDAALAEIEKIDSALPNGGGPAIQLARSIASRARAGE